MYNDLNMSAGDSDVYDYPYDPTALLEALEAQQVITLYIYPILLFFGTFGNIISFCYLFSYCRSVWSTCVYMVVNSIVELLILYIYCGNDWIFSVTGKNLNEILMNHSEIVCKVYPFLIQFLNSFSSWIYVAVSVELLIASKCSEKLYKLCTVERAQAVMLLETVLLIGVFLHYFWTFGIVKIFGPEAYPPTCTWKNELAVSFRDWISGVMELAVVEFLPGWIVLILMFFSVVYLLKARSKSLKDDKIKLEKYFLDLDSLRDLKRILFIICISFTLLRIVSSSRHIIKYLITYDTTKDFICKFSLDLIYNVFISFKIFIYLIFCRRMRSDIIGKCLGCARWSGQFFHGIFDSKSKIGDSTSTVNHVNEESAKHSRDMRVSDMEMDDSFNSFSRGKTMTVV